MLGQTVGAVEIRKMLRTDDSVMQQRVTATVEFTQLYPGILFQRIHHLRVTGIFLQCLGLFVQEIVYGVDASAFGSASSHQVSRITLVKGLKQG